MAQQPKDLWKVQIWKTLVDNIAKNSCENLKKKDKQQLVKKGWDKIHQLKVDLTDEGIQQIIQRLNNFDNLQKIVFPTSDEKISLRFLKANLPKLQQINLAYCEVNQNNLPILFSFKGEALKEVVLPQQCINQENSLLFQNVKWPNLIKLDAYNNKISPKVFKLLHAKDKNIWPNLRTLILWKCNIGPQAIKQLVSLNLKRLEKLDLNRNQIGDRGIENLVIKQWKNLIVLNIKEKNEISQEGFKLLAKNRWRKLQYLAFTSPSLAIGEPYSISEECLESLIKMKIKFSRVEQDSDGHKAFIMEPRYKNSGGKNMKVKFIHKCI